MESSDMKNMVVLKNLPSNMVEEAIIIFKETQKVRQKVTSPNLQSKSRDYILKEAEMLVTDYIRKIENKKSENNRDIICKYKKLKKYSLVSTILLLISLIINFI